MNDWNVVITVHEDRYSQARKVLERFGPVEKTDFFNLLLMQATDDAAASQGVTEEADGGPLQCAPLARVMPVT